MFVYNYLLPIEFKFEVPIIYSDLFNSEIYHLTDHKPVPRILHTYTYIIL